MARPRFGKLPAEQQDRILGAALSEFAARGFADASLNQIIAAAGISKGSFYYYFDSKEDLYAHVARHALTDLVERAGPFRSAAEATDPDAFWVMLADFYLRLMRGLLADPELAALVRGWVAAAGNPALQEAQREVEQTALPWLVDVLAAGQAIEAVRTDLPDDLLLAVAMGMGQAMDMWLIGSAAAGGAPALALEEAVPALMGMIRRALEP